METIKRRYLYHSTDRHGNIRYYFRRRLSSKRLVQIRIREQPGTEAFELEYLAAMRMHGVSLASVTDADKSPGTIYFVGFDRWVKIGFTTDLANRIASLQTSCPERLVIHASFPGIKAYERRLHQRFSSDRAMGEWFKFSRAITIFLATVSHKITEAYETPGKTDAEDCGSLSLPTVEIA